MPLSSGGERVPLVTTPIGVPPARMGWPWRGTPLSRTANPTSPRAGPARLPAPRAGLPLTSGGGGGPGARAPLPPGAPPPPVAGGARLLPGAPGGLPDELGLGQIDGPAE